MYIYVIILLVCFFRGLGFIFVVVNTVLGQMRRLLVKCITVSLGLIHLIFDQRTGCLILIDFYHIIVQY